MVKTESFEQVEVSTPEALHEWLTTHHTQQESIWLVTFKKHVSGKYVAREEVLDELIAFGWIDGVRRKLDADRTMQLISPRKAQHWAQTYKDRAARLEADGRMMKAGRAAIARSKAEGLWDFMKDVDARIKPDDLIEALKAYPHALAHFDGFPPASQRFVLRWIKLAKTAKTRAKRIAETARLAAQNERIPGS